MFLVSRPLGAYDYTTLGLPNAFLEPFDFERIMFNHFSQASGILAVQFEDQIVPVERSDVKTLAVFLSIYHDNTVRKNNEVSVYYIFSFFYIFSFLHDLIQCLRKNSRL